MFRTRCLVAEEVDDDEVVTAGESLGGRFSIIMTLA